MFGLFKRKPKRLSRKGIPLSLRYSVLVRDRFRCIDCGRSPATDERVTLQIDHIVPVSHGGQTELSNLATRCADCNLGKGVRAVKSNGTPTPSVPPGAKFWVSSVRGEFTPIHAVKCRYHKMGGDPDRRYYDTLEKAQEAHPGCQQCRRCLGG